MRKRLLDVDPLTKTDRWFHWDATGDEFVAETRQDVSDIIEANQAEYAQTDEHAKWGEFRKVGSIPMSMFYQVCDKDGFVRDDKAVLRYLQDRDNLKLRTRPGRLI